ncbi:MAG: alpha-E domain-containing protein [Methylobacteriaceae bacterium]|nr:alpha-E domain-containing protein [Methylobacteriaceae bacterium]
MSASQSQTQAQRQGPGPAPDIPERHAPPRHALLSRTADNLFWLARLIERADFLARIIEATQRLAALPQAYGGTGTEWESALVSSGAAEAFHAEQATADEASVIEFLAFSPKNPSSIRSCIELARTNARSVRTALTVEMWDAVNGAWLELKRFEAALGLSQPSRSDRLARFLDFVKETSLRFDGSVYRTMLRNDAYWFSRLGLYIERADNTARILDVKYHVLLPETETIGGSLDYFQWAAILRAVSALTAYHWVYRENIRPWLIADLLILRPEMPLSLRASYNSVVEILDAIAKAYGRQGQAQRQARTALARLANTTIDQVFQTGLHEFITAFIGDNTRLGLAISEQYLV